MASTDESAPDRVPKKFYVRLDRTMSREERRAAIGRALIESGILEPPEEPEVTAEDA